MFKLNKYPNLTQNTVRRKNFPKNRFLLSKKGMVSFVL